MAGARIRGPGIRRASRDGSLTVEFALLAAVLLMILGGLIDIVRLSGMNREMERSSTQIAAILTSCLATGDGACFRNTLLNYLDRQSNALVSLPSNTSAAPRRTLVSIVQVAKVDDALRVCAGNTTYLDPDVAQSASAVLSNRNTAVVVVIETDYVSLLPKLTEVFLHQTGSRLRAWTTSVYAISASAAATQAATC
ncbi:TadE/TadG family type IV pilus assembly protein [Methylobacterium planeticum]|uniref:TadE-like domain-containing protein n=1 Tax=Methylobacterium planeticum TaxID=2615211 RepID=A0A6N6MN73_9HYPH|nr:TadE/TadG family type IV pilus assembly protein [Methylobacterium planeticum]KAB1072841.1 hypothetical protein F6X51_14675 [Methylobacterium planeticum]